jgi:hypothetical protein
MIAVDFDLKNSIFADLFLILKILYCLSQNTSFDDANQSNSQRDRSSKKGQSSAILKALI